MIDKQEIFHIFANYGRARYQGAGAWRLYTHRGFLKKRTYARSKKTRKSGGVSCRSADPGQIIGRVFAKEWTEDSAERVKPNDPLE
jgi:hypothetical protein